MAETSLFFAADPAGSDPCWNKLLQAQARFGLDATMVAGRLLGYGVQAIFPRGSGWSTRFDGPELVAASTGELRSLEAMALGRGLYPCRMDPDRFASLTRNPAELEALFSRLARESLDRWLERAAAVDGLRLFVVLGDEEPDWVAELIAESPVVHDLAGRVLPLDEEHEAVGRSRASPGSDAATNGPEPAELFARARDVYTSVLVSPLPPHGSGLDRRQGGNGPAAAASDRGPVRLAIERFQPVVALCGSALFRHATATIGRTLCLAPGVSANGMARGFILVLSGTGVKGYQAVTG